MKKNICQRVLLAFTVAATLTAIAVQADDRADSQQAVASFVSTDSSIQKLIDESAGYAVFPDVGKGGFIVGGARGKGLLYEKKVVTGDATMTQASIGAQAGGQSFAEIIFFETPAAVSDFKTGKFEMSADVSAVAARQGAAESAKYKNGVAVFVLPKKGLMVQASIGGQKFKFEPLQPTGH